MESDYNFFQNQLIQEFIALCQNQRITYAEITVWIDPLSETTQRVFYFALYITFL